MRYLCSRCVESWSTKIVMCGGLIIYYLCMRGVRADQCLSFGHIELNVIAFAPLGEMSDGVLIIQNSLSICEKSQESGVSISADGSRR